MKRRQRALRLHRRPSAGSMSSAGSTSSRSAVPACPASRGSCSPAGVRGDRLATPRTSPAMAALRRGGRRVSTSGHDAAHRRAPTPSSSPPRSARATSSWPPRARGAAGAAPGAGPRAHSWATRRVAVAGANGKTTTTSMLTVALQAAAAPTRRSPSAASSPSTARTRHSAHRRRRSSPRPTRATARSCLPTEVAIVTNVQPDHLDFYGTFDRVEAAYAAFADTISRRRVARRLPRTTGALGRSASVPRRAGAVCDLRLRRRAPTRVLSDRCRRPRVTVRRPAPRRPT